MPIEPQAEDLISDAYRAVKHAQSTRKAHARRSPRDSRQRKTDIKVALDRVTKAMKPIRRAIARLPYMDVEIDGEGLREASQALQRERRKLWKMQNQKPTKEPQTV